MPNPINQQTLGPILLDSSETLTAQTTPQRWIATVKAHRNVNEQVATGKLLASAYSAFDKAGRELGIDASALAQSIDLAALIRDARDMQRMLEGSLPRRPGRLDTIAAQLAKIPPSA